MDSGFVSPYDFNEFTRAIQAAPNGTWIDFNNLHPLQWMKCTDCGAEMDVALTQYHTHEVQS